MYFYIKIEEVYILNIFPYLVSPKKIFLTAYILINALFVLKYSERIEIIPSYVSAGIYMILVITVFFFHQKLKFFLNSIKKMNFILVGFSLIFFLLLIAINLNIDGLKLNSDRWSALEVLIKSILEIKYPYAVLDHLGNTTSNLPGLFYLGIPFYLLGDVGFLQPFTFLFFSLFVIFSKIKNHEKVFVMLLILLAPSYFWEVFAKSDLMSNCIVSLMFISIWHQKFKGNIFRKKGLLALIIAFLVLTRGIVIIPLTIFLFYPFLQISLKRKISFLFYFVLFVILISLPVLISLPDIDFIKEHNPFNHQTSYAPKILIVVSLLLPFLCSFKVKKSADIFRFATYILGGLMVVTFILNCIEEGFYENVIGNLFDISYLSMILPFIIFYFLENFKNKNAIVFDKC
jgi:hypothetical protein